MKGNRILAVGGLVVGMVIGALGVPSAHAYAELDGPCDPTDLTAPCNSPSNNCTTCPANPNPCSRSTIPWCCPSATPGQTTRVCTCEASNPGNCTAGN